jgi:glucosamine 6-phosphate synthetase-like amidotransferase/phosphosugar isomerase protein
MGKSESMADHPQDSLKSSSSSQSPPAMLREIYEQPQALRETIQRNIEGDKMFPFAFQATGSAFSGVKKIIIAASGSSRNAGLAGEIMIEDLAGVAVDVEYSSEYGLRSSHQGAEALVALITQSGETADTVAAQRKALNHGDRVIFVPSAPELLLPILEVVPLQLFAYHFAKMNGCDVDHPRHLVKAVVRE